MGSRAHNSTGRKATSLARKGKRSRPARIAKSAVGRAEGKEPGEALSRLSTAIALVETVLSRCEHTRTSRTSVQSPHRSKWRSASWARFTAISISHSRRPPLPSIHAVARHALIIATSRRTLKKLRCRAESNDCFAPTLVAHPRQLASCARLPQGLRLAS